MRADIETFSQVFEKLASCLNYSLVALHGTQMRTLSVRSSLNSEQSKKLLSSRIVTLVAAVALALFAMDRATTLSLPLRQMLRRPSKR